MNTKSKVLMKAEKVVFTIRKIKPFLSDGLLFIKGTN